MGHEFSIDVDALEMFHGHGWLDLGEPCPHGDCPHNAQSVIGWGPTTATYELVECDLCHCRGWQDGRAEADRDGSPESAAFFRRIDFRVPTPADDTDGGDR